MANTGMSLQDALNKRARTQSASNGPAVEDIIFRPTEFKDDTVVGEVVSGPDAGMQLEISYGTHEKALKKADFTKKTGKSYVNISNGGTLRVEGVRKNREGGVSSCRWMKTFNGKPTAQQELMVDVVCAYMGGDYRDGEGRPKHNIRLLKVEDEILVTSFDEIEAALAKTLESGAGIAIYGAENGSPVQAYFMPKYSQNDDKEWVAEAHADHVARVMAGLTELREAIDPVLADTGLSIVPCENYRVGADTADLADAALKEAEEQGKVASISTVDPRTWNSATIGQRLAGALRIKDGDNAIPKASVEKLEAAFKSFADKDELAAFSKKGWAALSDDLVKKFFATADVELKDHPTLGFAVQSLLEFRRENADKGIIVKAFGTRRPCPYPAVQAFEGVRADYYGEMKAAVEAALGNLRVEAGATSDAKKEEKAAKAAAASAPKDELPADVADDLDGMLDEVANNGDLALEG